jgi:beta-glucosidase
MDKKILEFPKEFLFGSATAAHQVEGNEGERNTDWDVFMKQYPEIINMHEKGPEWWKQGRAEHDIQTMANLGMKVQRIGISWGRIEPQKGNINLEAVARYKEISYFFDIFLLTLQY